MTDIHATLQHIDTSIPGMLLRGRVALEQTVAIDSKKIRILRGAHYALTDGHDFMKPYVGIGLSAKGKCAYIKIVREYTGGKGI